MCERFRFKDPAQPIRNQSFITASTSVSVPFKDYVWDPNVQRMKVEAHLEIDPKSVTWKSYAQIGMEKHRSILLNEIDPFELEMLERSEMFDKAKVRVNSLEGYRMLHEDPNE